MTKNLKLNITNWFKRQTSLVCLFILSMLPLMGSAQQYPVRIIPVITPPYSLKLADYAHAPDSKLQLQVLMTDLLQPQHHTGIKFFLQAGLNAQPIAQSNEFIIGQRPFLLSPGSSITLTSSEIRHLFELQNINGLNPQQYATPLPEGLYQFCFQAYDFYTKNNLSEKACASIFLNLYDPPQLNIPQNAEKIQAFSPYGNGSGILFQWMPRKVAPNTKYCFILKEIWDTNQSPISAFLASPVLWKEETFAPNLYYSIDKTQLIPGRRYAWQVQAISSNPFDSFNNFTNQPQLSANYKNNGLSEIFFFDYVENCQTPTLLMEKNKGRGKVQIQWSFTGNPSGLYKIQYRKKGANTPWMITDAYQNSAFITGLEDLTEYEYRVGAVCGNVAIGNSQFENNENAYAFSSVQFFTTDSQDKQNNNFQCGVMPAVDITNREPLRQVLVPNDTFTAGDFPVTIISAEGSNGTYSGTGFIVVPYLADTKIAISFKNILINSDKKLIEGILETEYDPNESAVHFASTGLGELFGDTGIKDITLDYNVSDVQFIASPPPGKIIITGDNGTENNDNSGSGTGSTQELPAGKDYTIVDKNGKVWSIDEDGNITEGQKLAEGGKSTPKNTEGMSPKGDIEQYTAKGINLSWDASISAFEYDTPEISGLHQKGNYKTVKDAEGKIVTIPFKAVVNGKKDVITAKVSISDNDLKDAKIVFKALESGKNFEAEKQGSELERTYKISLKGTAKYAEELVVAVLIPKDSTQKQKVISAFNLVHLEPKKINLALVPLDEKAHSKIDNIKNNINKIYNRIGVDFEIKSQKVMDINDIIDGNTIDTEDTDFGKTYSKQQELINNRYKADNEDRYVLFITSKNASKGQKGYFRLNGQFGFIFGNADDKTPAHELGHAVFRLEHPWETLKTKRGETNLLMDYGNGTILSHIEWKQINDPKLKIYAFQEQSEGESLGADGVTFILDNDANFITPNGNIVQLPKGTIIYQYCLDINVNNNDSYGGFPNGALYGFKVGEEYYVIKDPKTSNNNFQGYSLVENGQYKDKQYPILKASAGKKNIVFLNYTENASQPHFVNFIEIKDYEFSPSNQNKFVYTNYINKFNSSDIKESIDFPAATCSFNNIPVKAIGKNKIKNSDRKFVETIGGNASHEKYKIDVYRNEKTGKYEVEVELTGKPFNFKVAEQATAIKQQIKELAEEKLNELGGLEKSEKGFTDNFGFYVADMTGKQWLSTIGELGTSVWENAALPENYWNEDEAGYKNSTIKTPALFAGVSDGGIDLVSDYPQLVKLGYDVATKEEVREGLWESVKNVNFGSVRKFATDGIKDEIDGWNFTNKSWDGYHKLGQRGVQVASLAFGGFIKKGAKTALEDGVKETGSKFIKKIDSTLDEVWQLSKQNLGKSPKSKILGENLEAIGKKRPENSAAHHIVPGGENYVNAKLSRKLLEDADIDINEATNGVFLPKSSKYVIDDAIAHSKVHTNKYYDTLYNRLKEIPKDKIRNELQKIANELLDGSFPY